MQIELRNVSYRYNKSSPWILKNINLKIDSKERIALIGPSGYGKSTLAKLMSGYLTPCQGTVLWNNKKLKEKEYCPVQMIYQHPEKAVNPRWKMKDILYEGEKIEDDIIKEMGIENSWLNRWPSELSGGELQRFCIARVLNKKTKFLICDEISTMLDVITQAQIWNLLLSISNKRKIGMLIVTHNIELAKKVSSRIINISDLNNIDVKETDI